MPTLPTFPGLPGPALLTILKHCDEPTRESAARANRDFAAMVPMARQADYAQVFAHPRRKIKEMLPTATELSERGCSHPDWCKIRKAFAAQAGPTPEMGQLRAFYQKAGALQKALKEGGIVWTTYLSWALYVGGEVRQIRNDFGFAWSYGRRYEGEWKNGLQEGQGVYTWPDGCLYEGEFKDGLRNGQGVYIWANGDRYEGEYRNDLKEGQGVYIWPNGKRYEGEYRNDLKEGQGVYTWPDGRRYEGEWKNGFQHGQGIYTWPKGDRYEGEFKDGLRNGQGVYIWANGYRYEGEWKDNNRQGQGICTWPNGKRHAGGWKDDEPTEPDVATNENPQEKDFSQLMQVLKELTCIAE